MSGVLPKLFALGAVLCFPGGVLWALSPLGVYLSEMKFKSPDTFWKLFPSAVALILVGMILHRLRGVGRSSRLTTLGLCGAILGGVLVAVGDVLKFYLQIDDTYLLSAPGWTTLRVGLFVFALGSLLFAIGARTSGTLPNWASLPLVVGTALGTLAVTRELGYAGAVLWISFGLAWAWLGLVPVVELFARLMGKKRTKRER